MHHRLRGKDTWEGSFPRRGIRPELSLRYFRFTFLLSRVKFGGEWKNSGRKSKRICKMIGFSGVGFDEPDVDGKSGQRAGWEQKMKHAICSIHTLEGTAIMPDEGDLPG